MPVLNNVRYASDSDHSRYESELTLWATSGLSHRSKNPLFETLAAIRRASSLLSNFAAERQKNLEGP